MKKVFISLILLFTLACSGTSINVLAKKENPQTETCLNEKIIRLKYDMQKLWIEHAWWTRSVIVSHIAGLEDKSKVLDRLLQNQVDIGNIIKPYYGEEAGTNLTKLLKEHILIAVKIIDAAKNDEQTIVDQLNKEWYRNADQIIALLTDANPNWSKKDFTEMFYTHLKLTTDEVVARLKKDWQGDILTADRNETHLIHMGDMLTEGIVKQFPEKFK